MTKVSSPLGPTRIETRTFHSCRISCQGRDQSMPAGGPTTRRSSLRCATSSAASSCLKICHYGHHCMKKCKAIFVRGSQGRGFSRHPPDERGARRSFDRKSLPSQPFIGNRMLAFANLWFIFAAMSCQLTAKFNVKPARRWRARFTAQANHATSSIDCSHKAGLRTATFCQLSYRFHLVNSSIVVTHVFGFVPTLFVRGCNFHARFIARLGGRFAM